MTLLLVGIFLWYAAHLFKRVTPNLRDSMGSKGAGLVAILTVLGIVLMVIGYRSAEIVTLYEPMTALQPLVNLAMFVAVFLAGVGRAGGVVGAKMRHPMLWGMAIWGAAHLVVNTGVTDVVLFGSMAVWALMTIAIINKFDPWNQPKAGPIAKDLKVAGISVVIFAIMAGIHMLLGHSPFSLVS